MATPAPKLQRDFAPPATAGMATVPVVTSPLPGSEEHILSALSSDSLTNVIMEGFIRDNGFINPLNRGHFYTCRDEKNRVEGVALIGHTILFEASSERAVEAFAGIARRESATHLLMGEHNA